MPLLRYDLRFLSVGEVYHFKKQESTYSILLTMTLSSLLLGTVQLNVKNIERMRDFYHHTLKLDILSEAPEKIVLGIKNVPLVVLYHTRDVTHAPAGQAGLYHFAILFSSRGDLARTIYHILSTQPHHFSGSADHLVSEAFYFTDPEGNGIELYFDRDKSTWEWENKQVKMAARYIDPREYLTNYLAIEEPEATTTMGHFHLKVGNIEAARAFYVDILGFEVTAEMPSALFISVDGYHHHLGLNTWESFGSPPRNKSLGLERLEFILPEQKDLEALAQKLKANHIAFIKTDSSLEFHDPWKNTILVSVS